jgi:flavin-dependent dehydrogenase
MPIRATKRGAERTPLDHDVDVLICGASFAGLAVARELARSGAAVMVVDRYEIGERQTSACGIPTSWLEALDLMGSHRQAFGELLIHTPHTRAETSSSRPLRSTVVLAKPPTPSTRSGPTGAT